jgi:Galactosyltransferase
VLKRLLPCLMSLYFCGVVRYWAITGHHAIDHRAPTDLKLNDPFKFPPSPVDQVYQPQESPPFDYNTAPLVTATTLREPDISVVRRITVSNHTQLVVLVLSSRKNVERRSMIRRTWGSNHIVYFAIGGLERHTPRSSSSSNEEAASRLDIQHRLKEEQARHQDLIDTVHPESYRSLPHKLRFALRWILRHYNDVQWVLKADDDMFVRADLIQEALIPHPRLTEPWSWSPSAHAIVVGHIVRNVPVQRAGKWAEQREYIQSHAIYPPWPQGSCGYLLSRAAGEYIATRYDRDIASLSLANGAPAALTLPMLQGEDTSLGIWMAQSNLNVTWIDSSLFVNHGDCMVPSSIASDALSTSNETVAWSIGHRISPEQIFRCHTFASKYDDGKTDAKSSMAPRDLLSLRSRIVDALLPPSKDDKAYWSAMARQQSDQEAKHRHESAVQRREQRAKLRQQLEAGK